MRKVIIIILVVVAIPIYTYNMYILLRGTFSAGVDKKNTVTYNTDTAVDIHAMIAVSKTVHFEKKGRSPFIPYPVSDQPVKRIQVQKSQIVPKEPLKAPSIIINGIMWNPQNPIAMLSMPDGSSVMAKTGQVIANVTIKKIEKTFIVAVFDKKEYRINR
jgi:hypothetical protein